MVRHYKVKREGLKYVIDVEEPVSVGAGSQEAQWPDLCLFLISPDFDPLSALSSPAPQSMQ